MPNESGNIIQDDQVLESATANNTAGVSLDLDQLKKNLAEADARMDRYLENQKVDPATLYTPCTI